MWDGGFGRTARARANGRRRLRALPLGLAAAATAGFSGCSVADLPPAGALRSAQITYITDYGPAGRPALHREQVSTVMTPTPLDVDRVPGPDVVATLRVTLDLHVVLEVRKLAGAAPRLPVAVQAEATDPTNPVIGYRFGYDGRADTAPQSFTAAVTPASGGVDVGVDTVGPGSSLALLGSRFERISGREIDPLNARVDFAPVPTEIDATLRSSERPGTSTLNVGLTQNRPAIVDVDVRSVEGSRRFSFDGTLDRLGYGIQAALTNRTVSGARPPGAKQTELSVRTTGARIGAVDATLETREGGVLREKTDAHLTDLPRSTDLTLRPETASEPQQVSLTTSEPFGVVDVATASNGEPERRAEDRYAYVVQRPGSSSAAARITGLSSANLRLAEGLIHVDETADPGPFHFLAREFTAGQPSPKFLDAQVNDLPGTVDLTFRPEGSPTLDYTGSQTIGEIVVTGFDPDGFARSPSTGARARHLRATIRGLPTGLTAAIGGTGGTFNVDTHGGQFGLIELLMRSSPLRAQEQSFIDGLAATNRDGLFLRDAAAEPEFQIPEDFVTYAKVTGLRGVSVRSEPTPDIQFETGVARDMLADIFVPQSNGAPLLIDGRIIGRPSCMRFAVSDHRLTRTCSSSLGGDPQPAIAAHDGTEPSVILYEASSRTGNVHVFARGIPALNGSQLTVDLDNISPRVEAQIIDHPSNDPALVDRRVNVHTVGGDLGTAQLQLTNNHDFSGVLPPDYDGVVVRNTQFPDMFHRVVDNAVFVRVSQLDHALATIAPELDMTLDSNAGRPFKVDVVSDRYRAPLSNDGARLFRDFIDVTVTPLRPNAHFEMGQAPITRGVVIGYSADGESNLALRHRQQNSTQLGATPGTFRTHNTTTADITRLARTVHLCIQGGMEEPCGINIFGEGPPKGPTVKFEAAEPLTAGQPMVVNYFTCNGVPHPTDTCRQDGTDTQLPWTEITDLALRKLHLQMTSDSNNDLDAFDDQLKIYLDTDDHPVVGDYYSMLIPDSQAMPSYYIKDMHVLLPTPGLRAQDRKVIVDTRAISPIQSYREGTIFCPEGMSFAATLRFPEFAGINLPAEQKGLICDNPNG